MKSRCQNNEINEIGQEKQNINNNQMKWWNNKNKTQKIVTTTNTILATTATFPTTTIAHTAATKLKHMLAHHHTVTISLSPLPDFEYRHLRCTRPPTCEQCWYDHTCKPSLEPWIHTNNMKQRNRSRNIQQQWQPNTMVQYKRYNNNMSKDNIHNFLHHNFLYPNRQS